MKYLLINAGCALSISSFAPAKTPDKTVSKTIDQEFILIPSGSFLMGADASDKDASDNEKPKHKVTIKKPFYLGKFEVTQAQWEKIMGSNPYDQSRSNSFIDLPGMRKRITKPDHPATVSWEDAKEFIKALNAKEKTDAYRLPTEAEWEYAARAGTITRYSFGDSEKDLSSYAWFGEDFSSGGTHPVGQKKPNPWGLYDIHGNVWEWVEDRYSSHPYSESLAVDPKGPRVGEGRVVRGGSWHVTSDAWTSTTRKEYKKDYRGISIGFRIAKTAE